MKINKPRYGLIFLIGVPWFIGLFVLFILLPQWILYAYHLHWLITVGALIIALTSHAKLRLQPLTTQSNLFIPWFVKTFLFQLSLILFFLGVTHLIQINSPQIAPFDQTMVDLFQTYGLFPWGIVALFTITLGFISYCKKQDAYLHMIITPVQKNPFSVIGLNVNFDSKMATLIALSSSFAFAILLTAVLFAKSFAPITTGLHPANVLIAVLLLFVSLSPPFKKIFNRLFEQKKHVLLLMMLVIGITALLIVILSFIFQGLTQSTFKTPALVKQLQKVGTKNLWTIFVIGWWSSWIPLASIYLASIAKGLQLRQIIFGILGVPIILGVLFKLNLNYSLIHFQSWGWINLVLGLCGCVGVFWPITQKKMLTAMNLSYLPAVARQKSRDYRLLLRRCFQFAIFLIYLFLPTGIALLSPIFFTMTLPMLIIGISVLLGVLLRPAYKQAL